MGASASMVAVPAAEARDEASVLQEVRDVVRKELAPIVNDIDEKGLYPHSVLRALGVAGAYRTHLPLAGAAAAPSLATAIEASAIASESCLSTGFMMWCQATLAWYLANSDNDAVRALYLSRAADGSLLGGTGLSNPMKTFFGIERMRLKGKRIAGGYTVHGALPWVSNLGPDHIFGTVFELEDEPTRRVMFIADCAAEGVSIQPCPGFLALDGTATYSAQFRDAFIPEAQILADPVDAYLKKIRAGFILLQAGMGIGLMRDCIELIERLQPTLGHINVFLDDQAGDIAATLAVDRDRGRGPGVDALRSVARILAPRAHAAPAGRRERRARRARGHAPFRRARLRRGEPRAAPTARSLFRGDRHTGHQAAEKNVGGDEPLTTGGSDRRVPCGNL